MTVLAKKRYVFGGTLTANDADGLPVEHRAGDAVPEAWLAARSQGEIDILRCNGMLREVGAKPAPRPVPEPPRRLSVEEVLRDAGWAAVAVEDGHVINGPRGYAITVLERAARDADLKRVTGVHGPFETPIVVHRVGDELVATIPLAKLASRLVTVPAR